MKHISTILITLAIILPVSMPYALKQWEKQQTVYSSLEGAWCFSSPVTDEYKRGMFNGHGKQLKKVAVSKLTITNQSDRPLVLKASYIDLDGVMSSEEISARLNNTKQMRIASGINTALTTTASSVAGFLPGGGIVKSGLSYATKVPGIKKFAESLQVNGSFYLLHNHSYQVPGKKGKMKNMFRKTGSFVGPLVIPVGTTVEVLIFVPKKKFKDRFMLTFKDFDKNKFSIKSGVQAL